MSSDGDDAVDTGPDAIPDAQDAEVMPPDWKPDQDLLFSVRDGDQTVILEDQSQRPDLKYETRDNKYEDEQFVAQIEAGMERYQRSAGDVLAGAGLGASPDLGQATEALRHAINQPLKQWNANK